MTQKNIPDRNEIAQGDRWDLTPLFDGDTAWESFYSELEKDIDAYDRYRGRLKESAAFLKEAVEFHLSISRRIEKFYTYAHLRSDEDKANQHCLGCFQKAVNLYSRASERASFLTPEIQAIPDETMAAFLSDDSMQGYRFYFKKILRYKPHTLSEKIEQILAMSRDVTRAPSEVFGQLDNVDLKFGEIVDAAGTGIELSHGNFSTFLMNPDREIRKKAFYQYYRAYDAHKHTLATALNYSNKKDSFYSRVRNYDTSRKAALFSDDVSETVYENLIETVKAHLEPLFEYFRFRKQALGVDALHHFDTYVPVVHDVDYRMSFEEAVDVCTQAMAPLGETYAQVLKEGLLGGWVDRYENRGKRSGAYSSGCYDSLPYILLNYEEKNMNSLYTLIHEAGHSMHSYYSVNSQPYVDYEYTIFVAEVASTFNENLLTRYLLKRYRDDPKMTVYILNREIDNIRATLVRQTMFAEFETFTHRVIEENEPLTLEVITDEYRRLLGTYFGDTMVVDAELTLECLRVPHFYSAFYVYKYATGVSAAIALAERVMTEGVSARDAYIDFLKLGGSKFPLDELLAAGVDMRVSEPVERAMAYLGTLTDRLIRAYREL
jgi:oligoendopeptidase F